MNEALDLSLSGVVGGKTARALEKAFEMRTVRDLLWHFPRRYANRGDLTPLVDLPVREHVTVVAQVVDVRERRMQRRKGSLLEVRITDKRGSLKLTFFNQPWRARQLMPGRQGIFSGKVSEYQGQLQLQHPDYQMFDDERESSASSKDDPTAGAGPQTAGVSAAESTELHQVAARAFADRPIPIYPATAQVPSWVIERAVAVALEGIEHIEDPIPRDICSNEGIFTLGPALELIHRPERAVDWQRARDSMRFREAFELQLALLDRRRRLGRADSTPRRPEQNGLLDYFDASLPFDLTAGQREAGAAIAAELAAPHPMHRLLQGEVGSGKTLVALRAMLQVAEGDGQSALLAPTEVLAAQHFRSIAETLGDSLVERLSPVLLTSRMPADERRRSLLQITSGAAKLVVGTHALLGDTVSFYDLGFIVVDEQHRFGVEQRETLRRKGAQPHVLTMTATPIPRTVALTVFGDLEVSTMRDLPPGRLGIETFSVPVFELPRRAARVWARAAEEVAAGRQVYVVCPAIAAGEREDGDEEDTSGEPPAADGAQATRPLISVEETLSELNAKPEFAEARIASLTGAMRPDEKDRVMRGFAAGEIDILVATTVIEVGVNVPNASTMIVRDAERFGVSQLHQLRGRVGRGEHPGLCLLLTAAEQGSLGRERVEAVAATSDGFALAETDLELRREGDILGSAQSGGRSTLRLLRVAQHGELIQHAREVAAELLERDPALESAPGLRQTLVREHESGHLDNLAKS